tara:strand:- start:109 stop:405 length:297 start_codon:yes stop_codon:yes gene_type:complete
MLEQVEDRRVVEWRPENPLQGRVDLSEQPPDSVGDLGDLSGEVVVEPAEHGQLRDLLVSDLDRTERVRHRASSLRDDRCVSRIGLRLARVQVSDAPHR